jgi:hypothetical protein
MALAQSEGVDRDLCRVVDGSDRRKSLAVIRLIIGFGRGDRLRRFNLGVRLFRRFNGN